MAIDHPPDALPPGYRLGAYEILRVLGRGGFGLTYQARRAGVAGDMVAIKELFPSGLAGRARDLSEVALSGAGPSEIADAVEMFLREASLRHPDPRGKRMSPAEDGGGQNARATGGPGILPETKSDQRLSRMRANLPHFPRTGQDV